MASAATDFLLRDRNSARLLSGPVAFLLVSLMGCSSGEIHLDTGAEEAAPTQEEGAASGGANGSGGESSSEQGSGGVFSWENPPLGSDYWADPCVVRGDCEIFICDPDELQCPSCESSQQCYPPFPHCDASLNRCQECLDDTDCEARFGDAFGACSAGRCVECRRDSDCEVGLCDRGGCGHCEEDGECGPGLICRRDHCDDDL
jgi:hypothetical protein